MNRIVFRDGSVIDFPDIEVKNPLQGDWKIFKEYLGFDVEIFDKIIEHEQNLTQESQKTYQDKDRKHQKASRSCLHHGGCGYCEGNRFHNTKIKILETEM